ncbi:DUF6126 family protein [Streptomyces sp. NPDC052236]|uniref:DUF6126 family protein n=1 Tax=Streptomyces sp. NPDC052236 TaxID=3365686 RepID=UPI0037D8BFD7
MRSWEPDRREAAVSESEGWKERGVALRVFVYVFVTHIFAGFVWLLFYVGEHAPK